MNAVPIVILTSNWFIKSRGTATSISFSGMGISSICLAPIVSQVIIDFGWEMAYRIVAIAFWLFTIPTVCFLIREKPKDMGLKAYGKEAGEDSEVYNKVSAGTGFTRRQTIKTKSFILFSTGIFLSSLVSYGVLQHFVSYLTDIGFEPTKAAGWFSVITIVMTISKAVTGRLYERLGIRKASLMLSVMLCLSMLVFGLAENRCYLMVFILLFGMSSGIQIVPPTFMTNMLFGNKDYSANYGLVTTIYYCGMAAGIQLSSFSFDRFNSYLPVWLLYAVLTIVMLLLWLAARKVAIAERKQLLNEEVIF